MFEVSSVKSEISDSEGVSRVDVLISTSGVPDSLTGQPSSPTPLSEKVSSHKPRPDVPRVTQQSHWIVTSTPGTSPDSPSGPTESCRPGTLLGPRGHSCPDHLEVNFLRKDPSRTLRPGSTDCVANHLYRPTERRRPSRGKPYDVQSLRSEQVNRQVPSV